MKAKRSGHQLPPEPQRVRRSAERANVRVSLGHEISVYQEELTAQNEALLRAQAALEESRDRFIELYDLAPTGYVTLDANGVVLQCNLTAAALLGKARVAVEGVPILAFVLPEERQRYLQFLRRCRSAPLDGSVEDELTLRTPDGPRAIQLLCRRRTSARKTAEFFVSLTDVSERRALERERDRVAEEHAALVIRLLAAQDDERQRIARNLHDDIGQQHTVIRLKLDQLAEHVRNEPTRRMITDLRDVFARLDQRVHFVATELRPASLDLGLVTALEQYVAEWSDTFNVAATVVSQSPNVRFAPDVETHLYRIAQEALNNISKHADAHNACIILEVRDDRAVLIVEDDGRGFDLAESHHRSARLGLVGMRERAHVIGGHVDIESSPGQGTSVFVHVPLPAGVVSPRKTRDRTRKKRPVR